MFTCITFSDLLVVLSYARLFEKKKKHLPFITLNSHLTSSSLKVCQNHVHFIPNIYAFICTYSSLHPVDFNCMEKKKIFLFSISSFVLYSRKKIIFGTIILVNSLTAFMCLINKYIINCKYWPCCFFFLSVIVP